MAKIKQEAWNQNKTERTQLFQSVNQEIDRIGGLLAARGVESLEDVPAWQLFISTSVIAELTASDTGMLAKLEQANTRFLNSKSELVGKGIAAASLNKLETQLTQLIGIVTSRLEQDVAATSRPR